jgi:hypothetical protein
MPFSAYVEVGLFVVAAAAALFAAAGTVAIFHRAINAPS